VLELKFQSCKDLWSLVVDKARHFINRNLLESISPESLYSVARQELRDVQISRSLIRNYGYSTVSSSLFSGYGPYNVSETQSALNYPMGYHTPTPPPLPFIVPSIPSMPPTTPSNPQSRSTSQYPPPSIVSASQPPYRHGTPPSRGTRASSPPPPPQYHRSSPPSNYAAAQRLRHGEHGARLS
jgi:hypothetical protein